MNFNLIILALSRPHKPIRSFIILKPFKADPFEGHTKEIYGWLKKTIRERIIFDSQEDNLDALLRPIFSYTSLPKLLPVLRNYKKDIRDEEEKSLATTGRNIIIFSPLLTIIIGFVFQRVTIKKSFDRYISSHVCGCLMAFPE